ncbi:MAG TPA: NAD(P)H-hydrate dehydratase [Chloroflexia bacterium]|nr:NAD(P)H-hydrate dehydratase [Chloroflexia bacterium]
MNRAAPLVTAAEMRAVEAQAASYGDTSPVLMDRAARQIATLLGGQLPRLPDRRPHVLVLAGPGNNGGDGLWAAQYLAREGVRVTCYLWHRQGSDDAALAAAQQAGATIQRVADDPVGETLAWSLREADVVVDALLGLGLERDISGDGAVLIGRVQEAVRQRAAAGMPLPVVAVDLPTGIDSDSGRVRGSALPASSTITLGFAKRGLYLWPGSAYAGTIILGAIGVEHLTDELTTTNTTADQVRGLLPARPADANKGTFGSVMIVAGSLNYIGAASLAALGAMRVGVGLATLATPIDLLPILAVKLTECTFQPLPSEMGVLSQRAVGPLFEALAERSYQALLIGNGLGKEKETLAFMRGIFKDTAIPTPAAPRGSVGFGLRRGGDAARENVPNRSVGFGGRPITDGSKEPEAEVSREAATLPPLVIDADGLNLLAQVEGWTGRLPENTVLTPHPGEMVRLLGGDASIESVQADRVQTARQAAADWKAVVVLKGANTVIAAPDGRVQINPAATPALATAGTGDVLAGVIAGLLAQGLTPFDAAVAGAYLHGHAGELVAEELGDAGVLAGDIADALPYALRETKEPAAG